MVVVSGMSRRTPWRDDFIRDAGDSRRAVRRAVLPGPQSYRSLWLQRASDKRARIGGYDERGDTVTIRCLLRARPPAVVERLPVAAGAAVQIPGYTTGAKGQLADEASSAVVARSG